MKMKKQVLLWLVPVMLVAGVLSGCDNGGDGNVEEGVAPKPPVKKPPAGTTSEPVNLGVTVSPGVVTLRAGLSQQFTAELTGGGDGTETFTWTVEGGDAGDTAIDGDGILTLGAGETAEALTVKAALASDSGKYGTAILYIAGNGGVPEEHGIRVSPNIITVGKGVEQTFTAVFSASGASVDSPEWSVNGDTSSITEAGVLTAGENEEAEKLIVRAEVDGKYGTAIVYIAGNGGVLPVGGPFPDNLGVAVSPQLVTLNKGELEPFTQAGALNTEWSLSGDSASMLSDKTPLGSTLNVGQTESASKIAVKARDGYDPAKYGTGVVTVRGNEAEPAVVNDGLTVWPQYVGVERGAGKTFSARDGDGNTVTSGITWRVLGGGASGTSITSGGALSVALEETAKYLSVRAETSDGSNGTAVVTVAPLITVTLDSVTADGSSTSATTKLTLTFNKAVAGLTASNITLSAGTTGAQKGALSGSGTSWTFEVSGITADGQVTVSVGTQPTGYSITGSASATVYKGITAASLSSVSANGSSTTATTKLTLTFSQDITGLSKDHITLSGSTGAVKGALSKVIGTGKYELTVSNITADGQVTVSVVSQPSGYNITGSASANVYKGITSVTMTVTQVGGSSTATTTALTLSFSPGIANLALGEITISTGSTGAVKGTLLGSNTSYTLELTGIKADGSITVSVNKAGYSVASKTVTVYYGSKSLKQEFGVTSTGKQAVTDTFTEVSNFIKNGGLTSSQTRIQLGDYIDLEAGLSVAAYGSGEGAGAFSISAAEGSKAITTTASQSDNPNYRGALLRLIVVGINSFNGKNGNNKDHVVFHFQNIPVTRRMNSNDTNSGGYAASEMRKYLTPVSGYSDSGKFLTGLTNAGVPDSVLWAPKRMMSTEYSGSGTTQIEDKLWLPTEREMFGNGLYSNSSAETAANQARLDYYYNGGTGAYSRRVKYSSGSFNSSGAVTSNGESAYYWQASPYNSGPYFCGVHEHGHSGHYGNASGAWGCVPAFCVSY